jgi:hypothetical protein
MTRMTYNLFVLNISIPDQDYNSAGWCQMECCDDTTQETCYEYEDDVFTNQYCRLVRQLYPHLRINYFLHTQIVLMKQSHFHSWFRILRFPKEAALVQQVRRNAVQVSSLDFRLWVHDKKTICSHSFSSHNQTWRRTIPAIALMFVATLWNKKRVMIRHLVHQWAFPNFCAWYVFITPIFSQHLHSAM